MTALAVIALLFAAVPCLLFLRNLRLYVAPALVTHAPVGAVSVLIPARNEASNIAQALESVLANRDVELELIVLDDHSTDGTAGVVRRFMQNDSRVRLESAPPLPQGWCGKQHACSVLATHARHPWLVFMDADVRLAPDALRRMASFAVEKNVSLISGVPRQELGTFWEKLLIPLIHFVLLGFLPISWLRRGTDPAYAAGCGQLFLARADDYQRCGGHAAIRSSMHDGIKLPRLFRSAGFKTDLFDATPLASCRMYQSGVEVMAGLAKNATEGLASPSRIVPITLLLLIGQVLPFVMLGLPGIPGPARVFSGGTLRLVATMAGGATVSTVVVGGSAASVRHRHLAGHSMGRLFPQSGRSPSHLARTILRQSGDDYRVRGSACDGGHQRTSSPA